MNGVHSLPVIVSVYPQELSPTVQIKQIMLCSAYRAFETLGLTVECLGLHTSALSMIL